MFEEPIVQVEALKVGTLDLLLLREKLGVGVLYQLHATVAEVGFTEECVSAFPTHLDVGFLSHLPKV